jgi:hypothetical protein
MKTHQEFETEMNACIAKLKELEEKKEAAKAQHEKYIIDMESLQVLDEVDSSGLSSAGAELLEELARIGLDPAIIKATKEAVTHLESLTTYELLTGVTGPKIKN